MRRLIAFAVCALALSACTPNVIGDSIIWNNKTEFAQKVSDPNGYTDASRGRSAYKPGIDSDKSGWDVVKTLAPGVDVNGWLVVEIGTNDAYELALNANYAATFTKFVKDTVALLPNDRCLAWVTPWWGPLPAQSDQITAIIRANITAQPCNAVVEWANAVRSNQDLYLTPDHIHPNAAGNKLLIDMINAVIK